MTDMITTRDQSCDRAWLGQEISGCNRKLLCRDRISWGCVATGYFLP